MLLFFSFHFKQNDVSQTGVKLTYMYLVGGAVGIK